VTVAPQDEAGVADVLRRCNADGTALIALGGGTLQSLGNAPRRCDLHLSLEALRGVTDYVPGDLTLGALAGTTLGDLTRTLAAEGQHLPIDAPFPERATVGGTIAAGWAGPRRATYGRLRDLIIGSVVVLADGTIAHAGGMVVKNVSGYDMSKVYTGSLGTLAVIVRANLKAFPRPAARRLAVAPVAADARDRAVAGVASLAVEPSAALLLDGFANALAPHDDAARLAVLFEGSDATVERGTRELRSVLGKAGVPHTQLSDGLAAERTFSSIVDAYVESSDRSLTYKSAGLPTDAAARALAALDLAARFGLTGETIADLRTGDVVLRASARDVAAFSEVLERYDGAVRHALPRTTLLAGAPALRARIDAWGPPPSTFATMRAIKERFDPRGILAPGRYVGGL
jgi:glycolate oxidase FAD binding subunit